MVELLRNCQMPNSIRKNVNLRRFLLELTVQNSLRFVVDSLHLWVNSAHLLSSKQQIISQNLNFFPWFYSYGPLWGGTLGCYFQNR